MSVGRASTSCTALSRATAEAELLRLLEAERRHQSRTDLLAWCRHALAPLGQSPAAHHRLLIRELAVVARGETDRLMLFLPPGHAKSTYASKLFPAWFLAQHTGLRVIAASGTEKLAVTFSYDVQRFIRDNAAELGIALNRENVLHWTTTNDGAYVAAGAGAQITGIRADLAILDDVVGGRDKADSEAERDRLWNWWQGDVLGRLKPNGRVILIMTRWHEADLAGRLLSEFGRYWRVVNLPAVAEANDMMGRAIGAPLWPEWFDAAALERKREESGEREWAAQYQQRPRPPEGALFKTAMVQTIEAAPVGQAIRAWDLAATAATGTRDPDWTAGVLLVRTAEGRFVVADVVRLRGGPDEVEAAIVATASRDGHAVRISLPQDPGQAGKGQVLYLTRRLAGYRVESSPETGDKATRAYPVASQCNVGNLSVVRGLWNSAFLDELAAFPSGAHDDQVDALSRGFASVGIARPAMVISAEALAAAARH